MSVSLKMLIFAVQTDNNTITMLCNKTPNILKDRKNALLSAIYIVVLLSFALLPLRLQAQPSAQELIEKGDSCRMVGKYKKALEYFQQAYDAPAVADDVNMQLQLLERIMRTHDVLRHWKEMPESSYRLFTLAKEHGDSAHTAMALMMQGKRLHILGKTQEGMRVCLHATEMMKRTNFEHKNHELVNFYAILAKLYCNEGNYGEALRMSDEQDRYIELSKDSHADDWYHRHLMRAKTIRLEILTKMGRLDEADSIYVKYGITPVIDPVSGTAVLSYYRARGMNDKVMLFLNTVKENLYEDGDTTGRNMQRLMSDLGDTYYNMGDYQRAAEYYASTSRIADTLAARSLNDLTGEVHKAIDHERDIARKNVHLIIIVSCVVLLVVFILLMLYQTLMTRRKNHRMVATINRLMHYRDLVIQNGDRAEKSEDETADDASDEELRRFKEVDKRIMKESLFTNPDFGRDDLIRLFGVDKNALPGIINRMTGTNVSGYINIKRMEYAAKLIKEHPNYTFEYIAELCGIKSSATFIRNFKAIYDMTPSEYRKQLNEAAATPPHVNI